MTACVYYKCHSYIACVFPVVAFSQSIYCITDAWKTTDYVIIPTNTSGLWAPGRPNYPENDHCMRMRGDYDYLFDDVPCTETYTHVICEKELP